MSRDLADALVALATGELPAAVLARANVLLKDHVGVTVGGAPAESSVAVRRALGELGATGRATVLGATDRFPPPHAALANGAAAHALEMDDTHLGGSIHLGASVFSAALAAAEIAPTSGMTLVRAALAGYEVAARLAVAADPAAQYRRGFHPTGTCGAFGAAAAAGVVLGLDAAEITAALGVAGSQAAGSMEFLADGAWTKRLHPGWAASAGLHAAALARAGFRAPATVVDGRFGFLHAYGTGERRGGLEGSDTYELMQTGVKPHACCRYSQGPIDAVLALRAAHAIDPMRVARLEVGLVEAGFAIVCEPLDAKRRPRSVVDAQFSLPFSVAVALVRGTAWPEDFTAPAFDDPLVRRVMDRVEPVRDAALDAHFPRVWPCWVRVSLDDGAQHETRLTHPLGDPENFPSPAALGDKFARLARRALPSDRVAALALAAAEVAGTTDVGTLVALARSGK